jgi:hypothetical protein
MHILSHMKAHLWTGVLLTAAFMAACAGLGGYARLESADGLGAFEGQRVEIRGRISETPWQHLIGNPEGYDYSYYFDVGDFQIVLYTKAGLDCAGELTVRGTVVRIQGSSKRPGSKADESYVEFHIAADAWECR